MAKRKSSREPRKPRKLIARPAAWWRDPVPRKQLDGLTEDEAAVLIAQSRLLREEQVRDTIKKAREFSKGFETRDGFPTTLREMIRIPDTKLRKLYRASESISRATSRPFVTFTPKSARQKRAAELFAGKINLPDQKKFILHHEAPEKARIEWVDGGIQLVTDVKDGALLQRVYYFSRRPRSWNDVISQTKKVQREGMRTGFYKLYNSFYGALGEPVQREAMLDTLDTFFSTYSRWLSGTILGWQWIGTTADSSLKRQRKQRTTVERFQDMRARVKQREDDTRKRRLGLKVPKRRKRK